MLDSSFVRLIDEKKLVLDFDGVLASLHINWQELKLLLQEKLKAPASLTDMARLYLFACATDQKQTYIICVSQAELKGLPATQENDLLKHILSISKTFSIYSSNTHIVIDAFIKRNNLEPLLETVVSVEDVVYMKPNPEGLLKIVQSNPKEYVYVGNSINDELAAKLVGVSYLSYELQKE